MISLASGAQSLSWNQILLTCLGLETLNLDREFQSSAKESSLIAHVR